MTRDPMYYYLEEKRLDVKEAKIKAKMRELKAINPFYPVNGLSGELGDVAKKRRDLARRKKLAALRGF